METLSHHSTFEYAYEETIAIEKVKNLLNIGEIVSIVVGFLVYFCFKLKRDFIPLMAFEMPISSKRAITMNDKILKGKYVKFLLTSLFIVLLFAIPGGLAYLTKYLIF